MAGDNNEEEYLDKLLKSAMMSDEYLKDEPDDSAEETAHTDESFDDVIDETAAALENFSTMNPSETDDTDVHTEEEAEEETAEGTGNTIADEISGEQVGGIKDELSDEAVEESPDEIVDNLKDIIGSNADFDNPTPDWYSDEDNTDSDSDDILALDDENIEPYEPSAEAEDFGPVLDEQSIGGSDTTEGNPTYENSVMGAEPAGQDTKIRQEEPKADKKKDKKKKEKKKKDKSDKKKFSLKSFFVEEENPETGDETGGDENQKLIDALYADKDTLSDAKPEDIDIKEKKPQKEKKPKEKKPKAKKEKKPKPPKQPKAPKGAQEKLPVASIAKAVLVAAVIAALVIVGSKIFIYKNSMSHAREYFEAGNYTKAYNTLAGMDIRDNDKEFYGKVETVMMVSQGLESYESNLIMNNTAGALDAVIQAVGRRTKFSDRILQYEVESQVQGVYDKLLAILSEYGISEELALDYYSMTSYDEYYDILESYGGVPDDSSN